MKITGYVIKPKGELIIHNKIECYPVSTISEWAFYGTSITGMDMQNVQTIGDWAFYLCSSITSAYFYSDAPNNFGNNIFVGCADNYTIYYAKGTKGWTTPTWNGYPTKELDPNFVPTVGDLNGDKKVNTADAVIVLKSAAGMLALSPEQEIQGDTNFDNKVNAADAELILKFAAGMITGL